MTVAVAVGIEQSTRANDIDLTNATTLVYTMLRRHLRSTNRNLLAVARHRLYTYGGRAFAVAGPTVI